MGEKPNFSFNLRCLSALAAVIMAGSVGAEPIESIFINSVGGASPPPLVYDFDPATQDGTLSVTIDSLTVLVERSVGGTTVPEFISGASFTLAAQDLTDTSQASLASGTFANVSFELSAGGTILLEGSNSFEAGGPISPVIYAESKIDDVMLITGGELSITGGTLAADFDVAATLAGLGVQIQPSTAGIDDLSVDHAGSVTINLNPIPEPASGLLLVAVTAGLLARRRRCERS